MYESKPLRETLVQASNGITDIHDQIHKVKPQIQIITIQEAFTVVVRGVLGAWRNMGVHHVGIGFSFHYRGMIPWENEIVILIEIMRYAQPDGVQHAQKIQAHEKELDRFEQLLLDANLLERTISRSNRKVVYHYPRMKLESYEYVKEKF